MNLIIDYTYCKQSLCISSPIIDDFNHLYVISLCILEIFLIEEVTFVFVSFLLFSYSIITIEIIFMTFEIYINRNYNLIILYSVYINTSIEL